MKLNFKKALPILATGLLVGSSFAFAISSIDQWKSFGSDTAIVIGADAMGIDTIAAGDFQAALSAGGGVQPGVSPAVAKLESGKKLNIDDELNDPIKTLTDQHLPNLLAKGKFRTKKGVDYTYSQRLEIRDDAVVRYDREDEIGEFPQLFIYNKEDAEFFKYSLVFEKGAESDVENNQMIDFIDKDIKILGLTYSVVDFKLDNPRSSTTGATLTLMHGKVKEVLSEDEEKELYLGGKTYKVKVLIIDSSGKVKLQVNGEVTDILEEGDVWKLSDGTTLGIREVMRQDFAGGKRMVTLYLGTEKLEIYDDNVGDAAVSDYEIKINDEDVYSAYGGLYMTQIASNKWALNRIEVSYIPNDEVYIKTGESYVDPAFGGWELQLAGLSTEPIDKIVVRPNGKDKIQLKLPTQSGEVTIDAFYYESNSFHLGKSAEKPLVIKENPTDPILENYYFIVSNDKIGETYYMYIDDIDNEHRQVKIKDVLSGSKYTLTYPPGSEEANFVVGSLTVNVKLVDKDDLTKGIDAIDLNADGNYEDTVVAATKYGALVTLDPTAPSIAITEEEDEEKYQNQITIAIHYDDNQKQVEIENVAATGLDLKEKGDTNIYEDYTKYGTKVVWDKEDQGKVEIYYPDEQLTVNAYVTERGQRVVVPGAPAVGNLIVLDTELTPELKAKNLIVVGGSAVNRVAADLLGLSYPTYGSDEAWQRATGVTGAGQAIVKLLNNPYMEGKQALLVAGWEGSDTRKATKAVLFLVEGIAGKSSVKLDTSSTKWEDVRVIG
jgi:hypothetical protein